MGRMVLLGRGGWVNPRVRRLVATVSVLALLGGCTAGPDVGPTVPGSVVSASAPSSTAPSSASSSASSAGSSTSPRSTATAATGVLPGPVGLDGVNDPSCHSAAPPVVLLPGTLSRIGVGYAFLVPALLATGHCVWGEDEPSRGLGPVRDAAVRAAALVEAVRTHSGAATVDVVGFSRGGLVLRTALRENGLADAVGTAVLISPNFHGTTVPLVAAVPAALCPGCADQQAGSALITALDTGGDLDGAVRYAVVVTAADAVVTPWESQLSAGPPDRVRSVVLDQRCPGLSVRHEDMARHPSVVAWAVAALAAAGDVEASALPCP